MDKFTMVSTIINEFGNCAAGLTAYESPARPFKKSQKIKKNWDKMLKNQGTRKIGK